jgi:hypothetical protein
VRVSGAGATQGSAISLLHIAVSHSAALKGPPKRAQGKTLGYEFSKGRRALKGRTKRPAETDPLIPEVPEEMQDRAPCPPVHDCQPRDAL